jgi:hypothetical protein
MEHNVTPNRRPWKVLTQLTSKHTNFEFKFFRFKFHCVIKEFMISKVRLLALNQETICYTFNNNGIKHQSCTFSQLALSMVVTSS